MSTQVVVDTACKWCQTPAIDHESSLSNEGMCLKCEHHFDTYKPPAKTVYSYSGYGGGSKIHAPLCTHDGSVDPFFIEKERPDGTKYNIHFTTAAGYKTPKAIFNQEKPVDLVIDAGDCLRESDFTHTFIKKGPPEAIALNKVMDDKDITPPVWVQLGWPDMSAPPGDPPPALWRGLFALCPEGGRILVCCQGAHGRTGTALSAILISVLGYSVPQAVNFVRDKHCKQAVESKSQLEYLSWLAEQVAEEKKQAKKAKKAK